MVSFQIYSNHTNEGGLMERGKCGTEVFSRVTGFFRPVETWNRGKTEEFKDRKRFHMGNVESKICTVPVKGLERGLSCDIQ